MKSNHPQNRKFSLLCATTAAALMGITHSQAATITWSVFDITGPTDVSTTGTLVTALSGREVTDTYTVNGVTFNPGAILNPQSHFDNITTRLPSFGTGTENTQYKAMLERAARLNTSAQTTISFSGLIIGEIYQIQIWASDTNNFNGTGTESALVLNNGSGTVNPATAGHATLTYEVTAAGHGQYALGTFTADDTTQSFDVRRWINTHTDEPSASGQTFTNGVQLRLIPEPSTALLGGLGVLALIRRRR